MLAALLGLALTATRTQSPDVIAPYDFRPPDATTLVFHDTFDTWNPVWQPRRVSTCEGGCARVHDGRMTLTLQRQGNQWVTAQIGTKGRAEFTYGYFEVKAAFPSLRGVHSAFWLPPTEGYIVGQSEVDVAECMGRPLIWSNIYYRLAGMGAGDFLSVKLPTAVDDQAVPHVYGVDWRPTGYDFYIDGRLVASTVLGLSDRPKFLVWSMKVASWERDRIDPARLKDYRADLYWIRVWQ